MSNEEETKYINVVPHWTLDRDDIHKIRRSFKFKDFKEAMRFVNEVAELAEQEGHHPVIHVNYNKVELELWTHAIRGLFENDFIMAAKIDQIAT